MNFIDFNPAAELEGYTVKNWYVVEKHDNDDSTGGTFSYGYNVKKDTGEMAFLKAIDFSNAFKNPSRQIEELRSMADAYIFERDLLEQCKGGVRNVIQLLDHGVFRGAADWYYDVNYLIMERADYSVRDLIGLNKSLDIIWALKSLHNIAIGIQNLHKINVAHQDIKPSNALHFEEIDTTKIGDFGRASSLEKSAPHDEYEITGDKEYSPFEQLYGYNDSDWKKRRFGCDMFMFGNLIMTYFNNVSITVSTLRMLDKQFHPSSWGDTYAQVLPYLEGAFYQVIDQFINLPNIKLRDELMKIISELCHPNPSIRGNKIGSGLTQHDLQRYISRLDYLCKEHVIKFKKGII